ncbi:hypothetical protein [Pseudomonas fluorescens]|uniref:hypothetical protein n=1 Tax=Pseudomonas fluorescens TaxID=294 RepID=UPI001BEA5A3F|nr:hypothetical protein [Pseudomonas fluorescens]MBT2375518.1 hypothetical protein [Pseudomonas fluorescens]
MKNMTMMLTAREAALPLTGKRPETADEIINAVSAKFAAARAQGAKSVWIGWEEGYAPLGGDMRYQEPSTALVDAVKVLVQNGYFLVFDMQLGKPHMRVSFCADEIERHVDLELLFRPLELEHLFRDDDSLKC